MATRKNFILLFLVVCTYMIFSGDYSFTRFPNLISDQKEIADTKVHPTSKVKESKIPLAYATAADPTKILTLNKDYGMSESPFELNFPAKLLACSQDGMTIYVTNLKTNDFVKVELPSCTCEVLPIPAGVLKRLVLSSNGQRGYLAYENSGEIICFDFKENRFFCLTAFEECPACFAVDAYEKNLFVTFENTREILKYDLKFTLKRVFATLENCPETLSLSRDGKKLYAITSGDCLHTFEFLSGKEESFQLETEVKSHSMGDLSRENSLYMAKEDGFEIISLDLKTKKKAPLFHLSEKIENIEFLPEQDLLATFRVI